MSNEVECVVGIDLGMTNTSVSIMRNNRPEILKENSKSVFDSCVSFGSKVLVGDAAAVKKASGCKNTVYDAKRLIGRPFDHKYVQEMIPTVPYTIVDRQNKPMIEIVQEGQKSYLRPEEVSAEVLKKAVSLVGHRLQGKATDGPVRITKAVITVPVETDQIQKQALLEAAKSAGLRNVTFLAEPTAAALAYKHDQPGYTNFKMLVYDLGGGTFDVSVLNIRNQEYQVVAYGCDMALGGREFDNRLVNYVAALIKANFGMDCQKCEKSRGKLLRVCQKAKEQLSEADEFSISLNLLFGQPFDEEEIVVTREEFETECHDLAQRTINIVLNTLEEANLTPKDINEVIPVGGGSRIPMILEMLREHFGKLNLSVNGSEAIAKGAAIQAKTLDDQIRNKCPLAAPDFVDIIPLSVGVMTLGDLYCKVLPRGSRIPSANTMTFYTSVNDQKDTFFDIYEGERLFASDNRLLGTLSIDGLTPGAAGEVPVTLTMEIDQSGILHAIASHNGRNVFHQIQFDDRSASERSVAEKLEEAHNFEKTDRQEAELVRAKNALEQEIEASMYKCKSAKKLKLCAVYKKIAEDRSITVERFQGLLREFKAEFVRLQ